MFVSLLLLFFVCFKAWIELNLESWKVSLRFSSKSLFFVSVSVFVLIYILQMHLIEYMFVPEWVFLIWLKFFYY